MSDNRSIGVFDSGLGGLTVVKELKKILKNESIIYFGDTGRVPYGTRSEETIIRYAREDEKFLLCHDVKMIIAACGTVSSVAYMTAKELPVPFFEVVTPTALGAIRTTKTGNIGVIGTPATIKSRSHARTILENMPSAHITSTSCPLFVPLVEEGWINDKDSVTIETAKRYLEPIKKANVDTLILGCTHYPAIEKIIASYMGENVSLINSGTYPSLAAKEYLASNNMESDTKAEYHYYVSDRADSFSRIAKILLGEDIGENVEKVNISDYTGEGNKA